MKILNLSLGWLRSLSKGSCLMFVLATPISASESAPSMSFLEYLAEEESQSWMISVLEEEPEQSSTEIKEEPEDETE